MRAHAMHQCRAVRCRAAARARRAQVVVVPRDHSQQHGRTSACHCSPAAGPGPGSQLDPQQAWQQLLDLKGELDVAVKAENFARAAELRDRCQALAADLSPLQQFMHGQLHRLRSASPADRAAAVKALGEAGDASILPELAPLLHSAGLEVQEAVADAMWAVFMRHRDPRINELMAAGCAAMNNGSFDLALSAFDDVLARDDQFAEAYNKRATLRYVQRLYAESIDDCRAVLRLNPWHFGAASGMGLCHVQLGQQEEAAEAFERALAIHPGLPQIKQYLEVLRAAAAARAANAEAAEGPPPPPAA